MEWNAVFDLARLRFEDFGEQFYVPLKPDFILSRRPDSRVIVPGSKPEKLWRHKRWPYFEELAKLDDRQISTNDNFGFRNKR